MFPAPLPSNISLNPIFVFAGEETVTRIELKAPDIEISKDKVDEPYMSIHMSIHTSISMSMHMPIHAYAHV